MQLCNLTLRLGGSMLHTVPVVAATPAEILVLKRIHGDDAVVNIRPGKFDKTKRHEDEFERLATKYDRAASASAPGDEAGSIMGQLFPGAIKRLPTTLKEIGLGHILSPASIAAAKLEDAEVKPDDAGRPIASTDILPDLETVLNPDEAGEEE